MGLSGAEIVYAFKKGTAWGTAIVAAAGDGILGLPWAADPDNGLVVDDSLGQYFAVSATPGQTKLQPVFNTYARYNDEVFLSMLAAVFGTAGVPATHAAGTLSKDHVLKINKTVDGIFFTLCAKIGTGFVEEIPSWKINKVVITFETGKPVTFAFTGDGIDLVSDSSINTLGTFASVTVLETANRAYMTQSAFRMNDASGIALATGDKIMPSKCVITLERKLTGQYGTFVDAGGRDLIDEPTNDGPFTASCSITLPRLKDNTGRLKIKTNTPQKMDITLTGPIIEGAIPYTMTFQFPNLVPSKNTNAHKQGNLDNVRDYQVLGTNTAPAGMTGVTDPCWLLLTNKIATDLLA